MSFVSIEYGIVTSGPLSTVVGANGLYSYGTSGRPTSSWNSTNYFVDVEFAAGPATAPGAFGSLQPPSKRIYLNGYWQDEAYFQNVAGLLRRELVPPAPGAGEALAALGRISVAAEPVFVHVRRERYQPRLAEDYYAAAIRACLERVPEASFFVFGDDAEWARRNLDFQGAPFEFLDDRVPDEIDTLHLMAACRHAITANSSFSWWGAWLGERAGGHVWTPETSGFPVVAPERWHRMANRLER